MLAAAGVTSVTVHARPVVTIFSTGDEVVPPETAALKPGQVRDATASALAALVADAGGAPVLGGIVRDDPGALERALREALPASDLHRDLRGLLGRRPGRDRERRRRASARPASGATAWRSSRASRPCWPSAPGVPGHRAAGQPAVGPRRVPADRDAGRPPRRRLHGAAARAVGAGQAVPRPRVRDRAARRRPGEGERTGWRPRCSALSALLSVLTEADGYIVIPEEATGLDAGSEVNVILYALTGQRTARSSATSRPRRPWTPGAPRARPPAARTGCPPSPCPVTEAGRARHRRADLGRPVLAAVRRRGHGRHRGQLRRHARRERDHPGLAGRRRLRRRGHRRPDARRPGRGGHARARALRRRGPRGTARRRPSVPARPVDRRGRECRRAAAP